MSNPPTKSTQIKCKDCVGRARGLLCVVGDEALTVIDNSKFQQHFKPGQTLFYAGNSATGIFCVLNGTIKLENLDSEGKSQIVQVYSSGSMIGYRALFTEEPYQSSAIAVEAADVCFIPKSTIMDLVQEQPDLAFKFLVQLSNDFKMMESRMQRILGRTASERIAEALLFLRENFEDKNWTRKEIAEWAGTTTETVIRSLADLEDEGVIEQKGRAINILKRDQLLACARIGI
ncbi:MAG: Crp/Fnr family transcriptional regulator [Bdellovibrionales bacterium]|nr:Crp/Fnr family transcriptional regulator [Bdellovibrionales bacterium]